MEADLEPMVIVGSSGHSIAALDAALRMNAYRMIGWLDTFKPAGEIVAGYEVLGSPVNIEQVMKNHGFTKVFLGISNNYTRRMVWETMKAAAPDLELVSVVHPLSCVSPTAQIGAGTLVMGGAVINPGCSIGENCIVNTKASLDHDSVMKPYASILPGVTTGGNVSVGTCSCVCLGSTVSHGIKIGEHSYVGAASAVIRDIPDYVLAYGVPAKVVRSRTEDEKHF